MNEKSLYLWLQTFYQNAFRNPSVHFCIQWKTHVNVIYVRLVFTNLVENVWS